MQGVTQYAIGSASNAARAIAQNAICAFLLHAISTEQAIIPAHLALNSLVIFSDLFSGRE
jgi:hypothetical protein